MSAPDVGTGATLTFQSGFAAKITSMQIDGYEVPVIDIPNMADSGTHSRIFGRLKSPPVLTVELLLDPDEDPDDLLGAAAETVTITFPLPSGESVAATWVFTGKATAYQAGIPVEDAMTGTVTITAKSAVTATAAS